MNDLDHRLERAGALLDRLAADTATDPAEARVTIDPGHRSRRPLVASLAAVVLLAGGLWATARPREPSTRLSAPGVAVLVPEAARVLPAAAGWTMRSVSQVTTPRGEVVFGDGTHEATLDWRSSTLGSLDPSPTAPRTIAGFPGADRIQQRPDVQWVTWSAGGYRVNLRTSGDSPAAVFDELVDSLRRVDPATWVDALPASAQRRDGPGVDEVLSGVPLPPGLTVAAIRAALPEVANRYQLTAEVTGEVACGWIASWLDARERGDAAAATAAVDAMRSSRTWTSLVAIQDEGGWSDEVWQYADGMEHGTPIPGGSDGLTVEESYQGALGCD